MFLASRAASYFRAVMPYAQWAIFAAQLGYHGYNLYQQYRAQAERDYREGNERTFDETMELVVRPRRRRNVGNSSSTPDFQSPSLNNRGNNNTTSEPTTSSNVTNQDNSMQNRENQQDQENRENELYPDLNTTMNGHDPDVSIVYDSNLDRIETLSTSSALPLDEVSSNASMSIESTESSRGIVRDMYEQCFICARSLDDATKPVATLPFCMHPFHQKCLDSVLKWHPKCPVCDFNIFSPI